MLKSKVAKDHYHYLIQTHLILKYLADFVKALMFQLLLILILFDPILCFAYGYAVWHFFFFLWEHKFFVN